MADAPRTPSSSTDPNLQNDVAGIRHTLATDARIERERKALDQSRRSLGSSGGSGPGAGSPGVDGAALVDSPDVTAASADRDLDPLNEEQAELMAQARAQSGEPARAAADQTRAEGRLGSISDGDGI